MKKSILLFLFSAFINVCSYSQLTYGFSLGGNSSSLKGDAVKSLSNAIDLTNGIVKQKSNTGVSLRGFVEIPLSEKFSVEPGLSYNQRGYSLKGELSSNILKILNANTSLSVNNNYVGIDALAKIKPTKGLSIKAGPQINFLTNSNVKMSSSVLGFSLLNKSYDITNSINKLDVGITGALAYEFESGVSVSGFYTHGFSPVDKNSNFKAYNRTAGISVGFAF